MSPKLRLTLTALAVVSVWMLFPGCAEGPFGGLAPINPWMQKNFAADERYGPTFHRRLSDLRALRSAAGKLDAAKKAELAADLTRQLAAESNPVLRAEMVSVLGEIADASAAPGLTAALADPDKDVRINACRAWAKAGPAAIPLYTDLLAKEADVDVRLAAIRELGQFQDPAAVQALGQALEDNDPAVQHLAVQSLKTSTGRDLGDSVPAWRDFVQGREPQTPSGPSLVERITNLF